MGDLIQLVKNSRFSEIEGLEKLISPEIRKPLLAIHPNSPENGFCAATCIEFINNNVDNQNLYKITYFDGSQYTTTRDELLMVTKKTFDKSIEKLLETTESESERQSMKGSIKIGQDSSDSSDGDSDDTITEHASRKKLRSSASSSISSIGSY